jgi:hypothetical protein
MMRSTIKNNSTSQANLAIVEDCCLSGCNPPNGFIKNYDSPVILGIDDAGNSKAYSRS